MDVIVGLGNPGRAYQCTRHNLGFEVIDALAHRYGIAIQRSEARAWCGGGHIGSRPVLLVKPQTYMNASGQAVAPLVRQYMRTGGRLMVVHDDIDLPMGCIKVKRRGGDAGHRGIRSIIACLGSGEFVRIRMGIGRPPDKADIVEYVLSPFSADQEDLRDAMVARAVACIEALVGSADVACGL